VVVLRGRQKTQAQHNMVWCLLHRCYTSLFHMLLRESLHMFHTLTNCDVTMAKIWNVLTVFSFFDIVLFVVELQLICGSTLTFQSFHRRQVIVHVCCSSYNRVTLQYAVRLHVCTTANSIHGKCGVIYAEHRRTVVGWWSSKRQAIRWASNRCNATTERWGMSIKAAMRFTAWTVSLTSLLVCLLMRNEHRRC